MNHKLLYIDLFCGAGGTSTGVERARLHGEKCAKVIACVNHDPNAIKSHAANHPRTKHFTEDIRTLDMQPLQNIVDKERAKDPDAIIVLWHRLSVLISAEPKVVSQETQIAALLQNTCSDTSKRSIPNTYTSRT